jgi:hypothetical protein
MGLQPKPTVVLARPSQSSGASFSSSGPENFPLLVPSGESAKPKPLSIGDHSSGVTATLNASLV